jgi:hypothetical protein
LAVAILAERQPDVYDIERTPLFALVDELRAVVAGTSDCGAACAEAARWLCDCQVEACVALAQSGTRQWLHLEPDATGTPKGTCPEYVRCRCSSNGPVQYASIGAVKALEFKHSKSGSSSTVLLTSNWSSPTSVADAAALYRRTSSAPVPAVAVVPVPAVAVVPVPAVAVVPVAAVPVLEATPQSHRRRAEEPAVVYAVRCFDDGASAGARARAGARAGTSAGASAGGAAADVHVQLHGLQTAKALEGWQRPVVRTRVMAVLLRQLFLEGAFAHGTPLWYIQRVYLEVHRRVDSFTGMTRKFCRRLRAAASARTACVVERAVCGMASSLRQLSTTSPNLDGCADRADRERRVHACALAGTLLNVLRDLPVSGHLGTEPTIVDMIMCVAL